MAAFSVSIQKSPDQRSKSCDTACSSNSSCFFQKRKPMNPLANSLRSSLSRSTGNSVRQRVLSAKVLRLKSVQNQLNDANFHLAELMRENQALKTLQKRQDKALTKYEGTNAELPRLIKAHEEEIRILTERNKLLRKSVKELNDQLKSKSDEVTTLQEQLKHFEKLDKDKHLLEREKLIEQLQDYKVKLKKADDEVVVLNRKLMLESKTSKQRLNSEIVKHKECQKELTQALGEIGKLTKLLESKERTLAASGRKRFSNLMERQTMSLVSLNGTNNDKSPVTEVKLQPISMKKDDNLPTKQYKGILKCPIESVKARLSATLRKDLEELPSVDKMSLSDSSTDNGDLANRSRPNSSHKLEKLEMNLQNTIRRVENNNESDEFDKRLGDYCLKAIDSVKNYTNVIDNHKQNLEIAKVDTEKLIDSFKRAESLELQLKHAHVLSFDNVDMTDDNLEFVNQILTDELAFKRKYKDKDETLMKKEPEVGFNDKKKLLATLRAIDNGETIDSFEEGLERKNKLMKELFGDTAD